MVWSGLNVYFKIPNRRPAVRKWLMTYFDFSRSELNGVCVLGLLLLVLWGVSHIWPFINEVPTNDISTHIATVDSFLATTAKRRSSAGRNSDQWVGKQEPHPVEVTYFTFDPNGLSIVDWKRLGLSERQIRMIKNYEAKGGRFRRKEDLAKIYAINEADYARLEPYITIKPTERVPPPSATTVSRSDSGQQTLRQDGLPAVPLILHIDLNDADSLELQYLPGIGPVFASRIVRFRDLLGGFHDVSQLMEVYGFDSVRFAGLEEQVYVDTTKVQKIALNTADYQRFRDHPFISHKLANAIVQYRKQHGRYRAISDLLHIAIMDEQIFRKIAPYLTLVDD